MESIVLEESNKPALLMMIDKLRQEVARHNSLTFEIRGRVNALSIDPAEPAPEELKEDIQPKSFFEDLQQLTNRLKESNYQLDRCYQHFNRII
jgi:hypothetical protein